MKNKIILKDRITATIRCQRGRTIEMAVSTNEGWIETDNIRMQVQTEKSEDSLLGTLELSIHTNTLEESCLLEKDRPIRIALPLTERPEKITALYMFNPWWTRPAFPASCAEIPDKTQIALLKFTDRIVCLVPMVGDRMKTMLCPGDDEQSLCMEMTAYVGGISSLREPVFLWSEGETAAEAVHAAFARLSEIKEIPLRENRRIPEMFHYLGWCSWDAFRTDISAEGVRAKAAELAEKQVPVRWMLIDDGWMTSTDKTLAGYVPDPVKFPGGFGPLTKELRNQGMIRWFGVWHALGGYWDGVDPKSCLASKKREALRETSSGRLVPDPDKGASFYHDWYRELRKEGIDFVKVDGQSICPFYYEDNVPLAKAARGIHQQLESGVSRMDGNIINCMGMAMENILARPSSAVSRNSDDFLPAQEDSFVEHLMQNAYNALYHNEIYCCDWDMFWTKHVHAKKHALLRAISGGPVYFSDKTGNTDPELLKCLALSDGRLLMMDRSAMPTEDCVFTDPRKEGVLKLHNTGTREDGTRGGGIAVLNLTGQEQSFRFSAKEIPELTEEKYWMFDFMKGTVTLVEQTDEIEGSLGAGEFAWYVFLPAGKNMSCLGLLDKYAGFMAAEHTAAHDDCDILVLAESGQIGWSSKKNIRRVTADGTDVTSQVSKNRELFKISLPPRKGKVVLTIEWNN